jgi:hypothetical protein
MSRQEKQSDGNAIRKMVWEGPYVETDEGRTIRGAVGQTYGGEYKAAQVSLYEEYGHSGRVSFSGESYHWDARSFPHKEQAIFAAREGVQRTVNNDRHVGKSATARRRSAVEKYAASRTAAQEPPELRKSR